MMTGGGMEKGMDDTSDHRAAPAYTAEDLERVVRRAAELQSLSGGAASSGWFWKACWMGSAAKRPSRAN